MRFKVGASLAIVTLLVVVNTLTELAAVTTAG
jgi:hypothetical protein